MKKNEEKNDDLDFEIRFYEGILDKKGDFYQALSALGDLYTKKGELQKGLDIDRRLSKLRSDDPIVFYNLSCSYSLLEMIDDAFEAMKEAISLGYRDFSFLKSDPDLQNLLNDERFIKYLSQLRDGKEASGKAEES